MDVFPDFGGVGGAFEYDNTTAAGARSMSLDVLTATVESTVRAIRTAPQDVALTFSSLAARPMGGTVNFAATGGVNGAEVAINVASQPAGFIDQGTFFNGADYAFMNDAGTYVRAPAYGTDADFAPENTFADGSHASVTATPVTRANGRGRNRMSAWASARPVNRKAQKMNGQGLEMARASTSERTIMNSGKM